MPCARRHLTWPLRALAGVGHSGASSEVNSRDSSFSFRDRPAVAGAAGSRPSGSVLDSAVLNASVSSSVAAGGAGTGPKSRFAAEAEKLTIGLEITDDLDLNKVGGVGCRGAFNHSQQE